VERVRADARLQLHDLEDPQPRVVRAKGRHHVDRHDVQVRRLLIRMGARIVWITRRTPPSSAAGDAFLVPASTIVNAGPASTRGATPDIRRRRCSVKRQLQHVSTLGQTGVA
jgi:hypothetical protein